MAANILFFTIHNSNSLGSAGGIICCLAGMRFKTSYLYDLQESSGEVSPFFGQSTDFPSGDILPFEQYSHFGGYFFLFNNLFFISNLH
ncbi:MAG: hypothetical protein II744_07930, partial [Eubacterium sp.]|nr:hypothetical protein [Eubacterium sp.]